MELVEVNVENRGDDKVDLFTVIVIKVVPLHHLGLVVSVPTGKVCVVLRQVGGQGFHCGGQRGYQDMFFVPNSISVGEGG